MGSSPVDEVVRKYAKYPGHLAEKDRLEVIKGSNSEYRQAMKEGK